MAQLAALGESVLLEPDDQIFIDAALASVIREVAEEIDTIEAAGLTATAVEAPDPPGRDRHRAVGWDDRGTEGGDG